MAAFKHRTGLYKFGIIVLFIATLALLAGVVAPFWGRKTKNIDVNVTGTTLTAVVDLYEGPWLLCVSDEVKSSSDASGVKVQASSSSCGLFHFDLEMWFHAVRATLSVGVVLMLVACLVAIGTNCCKKDPMPRHRMIEVVVFFGGMLSIAGVVVYNVFRKDNGPAHTPVLFSNYNISTAVLGDPVWTYDWAMYLAGAAAAVLVLDSVVIGIFNKTLWPYSSDAWYEDEIGDRRKEKKKVVGSRYQPYGEFYDRRARQDSKKDKKGRKDSKKTERKDSKKEKIERKESKKDKPERKESKKDKKEKQKQDPNPYPYPPYGDKKEKVRHNSRGKTEAQAGFNQLVSPLDRGPLRHSDGKGKHGISMDPNYADVKQGKKGPKKSKSDPDFSDYDAPLPDYGDPLPKRKISDSSAPYNNGFDYGKRKRSYERFPETNYSPYVDFGQGMRNTSQTKLVSSGGQVEIDRWNTPRDGGYTDYTGNVTGQNQMHHASSRHTRPPYVWSKSLDASPSPRPNPDFGGMNRALDNSPDFRGMSRGLGHTAHSPFQADPFYPSYGDNTQGYDRGNPTRGGRRLTLY